MQGIEFLGRVGLGWVGPGLARLGLVWQRKEIPGRAWSGKAGFGRVWFGWAWLGVAQYGKVR